MVSLSIDEFHIFKAAHHSWTLLALVRISNSRCYASRAHSVQKSFFKELPISGKAALMVKTFLTVLKLLVRKFEYLLPHYFLYFKRSLCRAQTMLWFLCHDQKKCILHWSHFTLFHRALMSVYKEVVWNVFWNPLLYF